MNTRMRTLAATMCGLLTLAAVAIEPVPLFSGSDSYVDLGKPAALQIPSNQPFTVEGWMLFTGFDSHDMLYCKSNGRVANGPYSYLLGFYNGNLVAYNGAYRGNFVVTRQSGIWYHVAFSFDGTDMAFYFGGEQVGTTRFTFANNSGHSVKLGGFASAYGDFKGSMSDVRVWNHARTQMEIQGTMSNRLTGAESGLLGYWPLNEGAGKIAYDRSNGLNDGEIVGAGWKNAEAFHVGPSAAGFDHAIPFTLADIVTGSIKFTNSNEVEVAAFPVREGYTHYQINPFPSPDGIVAGVWTATNDLPDQLTFDSTAGDSNIVFYAWFTNTATTVTVARAAGQIRYTQTRPVPVARATHSRLLIPGQPVVLQPEEIDHGSSGGVTGGVTIPVHARSLNWLSGPDTNATPQAPAVTVAALGSYEVELVVMNAAGNVATSSVCQVELTAYDDETFEWTGAVDAYWHNALNWNWNAVPITGSEVVIGQGASVLLSAATPSLAAVTVAGTFTFSGWESALYASTVVVEGTVLHLPQSATETNALGGWDRDNRVWIVCDTLEVKAGAAIDANGKGYKGQRIARGSGPGGGWAGANGASGGGHGGRGGRGWNGPGSIVYGDVHEPIEPGSAGGGCALDGGTAGFDGGGAVRIDASGTIVVNGTITANGRDGNTRSGSGSGGSIYIRCSIFQGTNGTVSANGGAHSWLGGGGGGGRIAVVYDHAAQRVSPPHRVVFSANYGASSYNVAVGLGSLYFSSEHILDPLWLTHSGIVHLPDVTAWAVDNLTVSGGRMTLYGAPQIDLTVSNTLTVTGAGTEFIVREGRIECDALRVTHGAAMYLGFLTTDRLEPTASIPEIHCSGDLTIAPNSTLGIYSAATNAATVSAYGSLIDVAGELRIGAAAQLIPYTAQINGASPLLRMRHLVVESGGKINADATGYAGSLASYNAGFGPGKGAANGNNNSGGGGGYGGRGGNAGGVGGPVYGSANAPINPGSGGGSGNGYGGRGGGLVRIEAREQVTLDGTLSANGGAGQVQALGGGSGGAIYVRTPVFIGGADAVMRAHGGLGGGGGGGGRIAVWYGDVWAENVTASRLLISDSLAPSSYTGAFPTVAGGAKGNWQPGEAGTVRFVEVLYPQGTVLVLR